MKTPKKQVPRKIVQAKGLPPLPKDVFSIFGFKLIEIKGKKIWRAATELDFRELLESKGITGPRLELAVKLKYNRNPCGTYMGQCVSGDCGPVLSCIIVQDGTMSSCYCG